MYILFVHFGKCPQIAQGSVPRLFKIIFYYSSLPFILNNLNNSTIKIGANTNPNNSNMFCVGNTGILNMFLNGSTKSITNIKAACSKY